MQIIFSSHTISILSSIFIFLKMINDDLSQLILVVVAIVSLWFVYSEFVSKRRPFTFPTLQVLQKNEEWHFQFILINKGTMPAFTKVAQALLKIGDEEYPTFVKNEIILAPNEKEFVVSVGYINKAGRDRILGHEYRINRVEIIFCLESKFISDRKYKYNTEVVYEVDVKGASPIFTVISQKFT